MEKTNDAHVCPVCGKTTFTSKGSYEICEFCGWEDEMWCEEHPDEESTANYRSLNEYRREYLQRVKGNSDYSWWKEMQGRREKK